MPGEGNHNNPIVVNFNDQVEVPNDKEPKVIDVVGVWF